MSTPDGPSDVTWNDRHHALSLALDNIFPDKMKYECSVFVMITRENIWSQYEFNYN